VIFHTDDGVTLHQGDALDVARTLRAGAADCIVTSPPYFGLRDYGTAGQYGLEATPADYVDTMRALFTELRRVLADDGTLWLNIGDSYSTYAGNRGQSATGFSKNGPMPAAPSGAGLSGDRPAKNMLGIPWRLALALQDDGWILRNAIVWNKPNAMPESVRDRLAGRYEHVFLFSKSPRYWFDLDPIREPHAEASIKRTTPHRSQPGKAAREGAGYAPGMAGHTMALNQMTHPAGRNPGDVWSIGTKPFPGAHFATFPIELPRRCIAAGCKPGGTVLDPFNGSGTTGQAAQQLGRRYVGIDISAEYLQLTMRERLGQAALGFDT